MDEKEIRTDDIEQKADENAEPNEESKKLEALEKKLELLEQEKISLRDQYLRLVAEFNNFKKRIDREMESLVNNAHADLVADLLPILDDLERSINDENVDNSSALLKGVKLVYKNFSKTLQDKGLQPMDCVGEEFDPEKHDAIMQIEAKDTEPNIVVEEHQKGYYFKDQVIRHSKVIVSK